MSAKIILIEPDAQMRKLMRHVLEWKGFHLISYESAKEALGGWPPHAEEGLLLIATIEFPTQTAEFQALESILRSKPALQCILVSQYSFKTLVQESPARARIHSLKKPFSFSDLSMLMTRCLMPFQSAASDMLQQMPSHTQLRSA